jgi:hypothetical protein
MAGYAIKNKYMFAFFDTKGEFLEYFLKGLPPDDPAFNYFQNPSVNKLEEKKKDELPTHIS